MEKVLTMKKILKSQTQSQTQSQTYKNFTSESNVEKELMQNKFEGVKRRVKRIKILRLSQTWRKSQTWEKNLKESSVESHFLRV